jgi:nickel/cobalt transporter (NiCoT) family protein
VRTFRRLVIPWARRDWLGFAALVVVIALLHIVGFGALILLVGPHHYQVGTQLFGIGLGVTAYAFGLRHAFDADHIVAIDNTTRKLMADGSKPKAVGFWFAMGHSTMVLVMVVVVIGGTHAVSALLDQASSTRSALGLAGTLASGGFLYLLAIINTVALVAMWRMLVRLRTRRPTPGELEAALDNRGFLVRILRPIMKRINRPAHMYPVGVLFGLGFDTASEVALLAVAGGGAAAGLPWYAVLVLPVLFAAGMCLMDTVDGLFMTIAYHWAFENPVRKIYYNLSITALSIIVALLIGTIELVTVLHDDLGWADPLTTSVSEINLNDAGFALVGLFGVAWICAVAYWVVSSIERRGHLAQPSECLLRKPREAEAD